MDSQLIQEGEGYRQNVYLCSQGHPTIGYGHKLLPQEKDSLKKVTKKQARQMLENDLKNARNEVYQYFGSQRLELMGEQRKAVLVDMAYNLGKVRWPKLTACLRKGDYEGAGNQIMDSKYAKQTKGRAIRNAQIMKTGKLMTKEEAKNPNKSSEKSNNENSNKTQPPFNSLRNYFSSFFESPSPNEDDHAQKDDKPSENQQIQEFGFNPIMNSIDMSSLIGNVQKNIESLSPNVDQQIQEFGFNPIMNCIDMSSLIDSVQKNIESHSK